MLEEGEGERVRGGGGERWWIGREVGAVLGGEKSFPNTEN